MGDIRLIMRAARAVPEMGALLPEDEAEDELWAGRQLKEKSGARNAREAAVVLSKLVPGHFLVRVNGKSFVIPGTRPGQGVQLERKVLRQNPAFLGSVEDAWQVVEVDVWNGTEPKAGVSAG